MRQFLIFLSHLTPAQLLHFQQLVWGAFHHQPPSHAPLLVSCNPLKGCTTTVYFGR